MEVWKVQFLGVPCALCGEKSARLRSRETWAVLASLTLPALLRGALASPIRRETLADRFWDDRAMVEPRTHLRQCLASLRDAFGESCLTADRHTVQAAPGWLTTDIELALDAYRKALQATHVEERLHWLTLAEAQMRGEFFEGWTPDSAEAEVWLLQLRAEVHSRLLPILLLLADTLEETQNLVAAFDIARRVLQLHPGHSAARQKALRLAAATGQQEVLHLLEQTANFRETVARFRAGGLDTAILKDQRRVQSLFEQEINTLSPGLRKAFLRLSVLPDAFSAEIADRICRAPLQSLQILAQTPMLEARQDLFVLPLVVRQCAWKLLPSANRRLLRKRLALVCIEALTTNDATESTLPALFGSDECARPLLREALQWVLEQRLTAAHVGFINMLRYCGLNELALLGVGSLQQTLEDANLATETRLSAGMCAAYILMHAGDYAAALVSLQSMAPLVEAQSDPHWQATVSATLMMTYSALGEWEQAREQGRQAEAIYRRIGDYRGETHCIRVQAEIDLQSGELESALRRCDEALNMRTSDPLDRDTIADARYWKARILYGLQRWGEAEAEVEEALSLWQDSGDTKVGLCLCVLGQIHAAQGRLAGARFHLEHALLLHRRTPMDRHRVAAAEALGDLFHVTGHAVEAHTLYAECLDYYRKCALQDGINRLSAKWLLSSTDAIEST
jgi:tetratricopeptide (TPR) repeat protein/DNA-binding SARP family transcriptional activator